MRKKGEKILLVIPAYNEEANILHVYNSIITYNKINKTNYDCIVVNDGSKDNTLNILKEHQIPYVNLTINLGIGGAVQTGYKYAQKKDYDYVVQYDGDGQHDISCIEELLIPLREKKADITIGSRFIGEKRSQFQSTMTRRLGIRLISLAIYFRTKFKIYDTTSGFRAINKEVLNLFCRDYPREYPEPISSVNALLNGNKIIEVPVQMKEREGGTSSITSWKSAYYMINVFLSILLLKGKVKK